MKKNYIELGIDRSYIELDGKSNVKITPIRTDSGFTYKIIEKLYLEEMQIFIGFKANRLGKAISKIKNSYFDFQDSPNVYNNMGPIQYKIDLLSRIKEDLKRKQVFQEEVQKHTR